jgi:hypothetical protein
MGSGEGLNLEVVKEDLSGDKSFALPDKSAVLI